MRNAFYILICLGLSMAKAEAQRLTRSYTETSLSDVLVDLNKSQTDKRISFIYNELEDFRIKEVESLEGLEDDAITRKMEKIKRRQEKRDKKKTDSSPALPKEGTAATGNNNLQLSKPFASGRAEGEPTYVRIKGQTSVGILEHIDGKQATVVFGQMRTTVAVDRLVPAQAPKKEDTPAAATFVGRETQRQMREKSLNFRQDIDVRGMRGEEALNAITHYIDDAIQVGVARVRILHGTGTGALRQIIRQYLRTIPAVRDARDEHVQFGGAGITVVDFN